MKHENTEGTPIEPMKWVKKFLKPKGCAVCFGLQKTMNQLQRHGLQDSFAWASANVELSLHRLFTHELAPMLEGVAKAISDLVNSPEWQNTISEEQKKQPSSEKPPLSESKS